MDATGTTGAPRAEKSGRPVILLVDDEPELLKALQLGLESEFEIDLASSAEEADMMIGTRAYDVVVSDHLLPGEEGLHFLVRVNERFPQTRRILITGYINPELISRSVAVAGLSACLMKPVRVADLAKTMREALK